MIGRDNNGAMNPPAGGEAEARLSAEPQRRNLVDPLLLAFVGLLVFALFHFQGNSADVRMFSRSVFRWMVMRWSDATFSVGEYSHGWLIPLVSLYALWRQRRELRDAPKAADWAGLWLVAGALALHWLGLRAQQPRISMVSLALLLWAIPRFLYGRGAARILIFPCFYLLLCVPFNFLDSFSFTLRILSTAVSSAVLNGIGIGVARSGSAIHALNGRFSLEVADPCSGIRSLLAMTALTVAYAHFTQTALWRKWALSLASVPLAVVGNMVRIVTVGVVAHVLGQTAALHFFHEYSGYVVFVTAVLLMVWIGSLLTRVAAKPAAK